MSQRTRMSQRTQVSHSQENPSQENQSPLRKDSYAETEGNRPSRHSERARYDVETVHGILDAGMIAHVAFVADGLPQVLPLLYVRVGTSVYLHGSTGAHFARRAAREGSLPVSVEVTLVDELVLARSTFNHSANYRSVIAHGKAVVVPEQERKLEVLAALVEHLVPGRGADARPPAPSELRQTAVLELPLENVAAKVRTGDPVDEASDSESSCWAGVWPLLSSFGVPRPSRDLSAGIGVPGYLEAGAPVRLFL
jgi:nitroimidazol reductase NimA-like FMN-containing flavoprotein (pyridoxamine 5'-phosphate oxidase superfamily)